MTRDETPCLTDKQREVARLVAEGWGDKAIGAKLTLKPRTVRVHIEAIAYTLRLDPLRSVRVQIARWWWRTHDRNDVS